MDSGEQEFIDVAAWAAGLPLDVKDRTRRQWLGCCRATLAAGPDARDPESWLRVSDAFLELYRNRYAQPLQG
jgi:hypothetical protein